MTNLAVGLLRRQRLCSDALRLLQKLKQQALPALRPTPRGMSNASTEQQSWGGRHTLASSLARLASPSGTAPEFAKSSNSAALRLASCNARHALVSDATPAPARFTPTRYLNNLGGEVSHLRHVDAKGLVADTCATRTRTKLRDARPPQGPRRSRRRGCALAHPA
jgi:hypothetical protein